jgi:hypothetical protein
MHIELANSSLSMTQAELDLQERILVLGWSVDFHSQQLDASVEILKDMERRVDIMKSNMAFEIQWLSEKVRVLEIQVDRLRWWDSWLLKVYRWWYGTPPIV